jgi:hypothetical protein
MILISLIIKLAIRTRSSPVKPHRFQTGSRLERSEDVSVTPRRLGLGSLSLSLSLSLSQLNMSSNALRMQKRQVAIVKRVGGL